MKDIEFYYLEIINETEQLMVFTTTFNRKEYGLDLMLNTALPIEVQDIQIRKIITKLNGISRKTLKKSD